ncbi:redoxin domain-containing protein [Paractinoplanes durhamensis]|uniref:Thioredoxin domain-containing protein n=1 Tax=Paractinoplanes durhamensis TaxID=113563 RepID=A0ABQ3ZAI2_9ACTN|nr:redoxin domain-containing protein [Actinoplanes durhamensis]GIE06819.1 hypothetical protein Adu01nite_81690 [Actinoplanes durhamensis]
MTTVHDLRRVDDEAFRHLLDRNAIWSRMVAVGDRLPSLQLVEADLGPIRLDRLRLTGPIVLTFVRYASSPACEAALAHYRDTLAPGLEDLGAHLVAVSPQVPSRLAAVKRRHDLGFFVAADPRHQLIDAFNIGFGCPGADTVLGARHSTLPFAAVVVADRAGTIRFTDIRPDWSTPLPADRIIAAVASFAG